MIGGFGLGNLSQRLVKVTKFYFRIEMSKTGLYINLFLKETEGLLLDGILQILQIACTTFLIITD